MNNRCVCFLRQARPLVGSLLLMGCHLAGETGAAYPQPVVAFGFVVFGGVGNDQMYFVPLKDSTRREVMPTDFRTERLRDGFSFRPSAPIKDALALLDTFSIVNQLHDPRLQKHMGRTLFTPVRMVYEIDPDALGVFTKAGLVDTITLGQHRYDNRGEKVTLVVRFPGADVLKISALH
ncbi:hypothetical protein I2I05_21110 [Hymenobacter sp. BT683]|uniref:Uncharacterized protein n=1 Tax=Hymenobacter jeongseonensis TaxID=2791027 RepID=A0ABS0INF4_9BACT|nr:hypothetical protein [Hymenobacter jeongseonensis]MBF9239905.1 hypothetical protein [Hymenobacter jeongseonensis]